MKHRRKGQTPSSKRSRSREVAIDSLPMNAAAQPTEGSPVHPVTPPTERVSDALMTSVEATPVKPGRTLPEAKAEPALTAVTSPSISQAFVAVRESPASRPVTTTTSFRPRAEQIVKEHLALAVGAGMIPFPGVDLAAIGGLQLKVLASLAKHYRVPFTQAQAQRIVTSLLGSVGTTLLAGAVIVSFAKIVPFFGTVVGAASMPVAGGVITRAMGHLAIDHFEGGGTMATFDLDVARKAFLKKIAEARVAVA